MIEKSDALLPPRIAAGIRAHAIAIFPAEMAGTSIIIIDDYAFLHYARSSAGGGHYADFLYYDFLLAQGWNKHWRYLFIIIILDSRHARPLFRSAIEVSRSSPHAISDTRNAKMPSSFVNTKCTGRHEG